MFSFLRPYCMLCMRRPKKCDRVELYLLIYCRECVTGA